MISSLFKKLYNWSYTILSNTLIELGRQSFKSSESPFLKTTESLWHISSRQEMCQTSEIIKKIA